MRATVEAVYHNGVFRPTQRIGMSDGTRVRLTIETAVSSSGDAILDLAAKVYEGLSHADLDQIEEMAGHRAFFDDPRS